MSNTGHHKDSDNPNANVNPKCVPTDRLLAFYRFSQCDVNVPKYADLSVVAPQNILAWAPVKS